MVVRHKYKESTDHSAMQHIPSFPSSRSASRVLKTAPSAVEDCTACGSPFRVGRAASNCSHNSRGPVTSAANR